MSTTIKNRKTISASRKYYDDLAKAGYTAAKDYQQLLFKPGKALQTRELNFLQSLLHEKIKNANDITYKNGSIIFGCDVTFDETSWEVTVGDGVLYWDGIFFKFSEQIYTVDDTTLDVTDGLNVYLNPVYETIDYNDDSNLYDPAILYKINQSIDGADRLKITFDILIEEDETNFDTTYPQSFQVAIINDSGVTLINRNPFIIENDKELDSEVKDGLKIRSNPMREPFSITDENVNFYNTDQFEKVFVEIEEGSGIINGSEVISSETKVFQIAKSDLSADTDKLVEQEIKKTKDVNADLVGIYGDISYGESFIDKKTFLVDMLQPGKPAKIKVRIPLKKTDADGVITTEYKIFEVCQAQVADVYELWKNETYDKIKDTDKNIIGVVPMPIDMDPIQLDDSEISKIPINNIGGISIGGSNTLPGTIPEDPTYDTSLPWRAQLFVGWRINMSEKGEDVFDVSLWNNLEMVVSINKLFDAAGTEITHDLSDLILDLDDSVINTKISPRSDVDILENSLIFNDEPSSGNMSTWIEASDDVSSSELVFKLKVPGKWLSNNVVDSHDVYDTITVRAGNPFVLPGNLFTNGVLEDNIPLKAEVKSSTTFPRVDILQSFYVGEGVSKIKYTFTTINNGTRMFNKDFKKLYLSNLNTSKCSFTQNTLIKYIDQKFNYYSIDITENVRDITLTATDMINSNNKNCILFHEFYEVTTSS